MARKCVDCGRTDDEIKVHMSNNKCTDCMRIYNKRRYEAKKAGTLVQTGPKRDRWGSRTLIMDESREWIFDNEHWEEYDQATHGTMVGANIVTKDFE